MKDALRRKLTLTPPAGKPKTDSVPPTAPQPKGRRLDLLRMLGANTLKLRYETGDRVVYRKHWVALILQAWIPVVGILTILVLFIYRLIQLAYNPNEFFISFRVKKLWSLAAKPVARGAATRCLDQWPDDCAAIL